MKMRYLVLASAVFAFSGGAAFAGGGCSGAHFSMAKVDIKKAPIAQSTKQQPHEASNIELADIPTDAWLIKYLT